MAHIKLDKLIKQMWVFFFCMKYLSEVSSEKE